MHATILETSESYDISSIMARHSCIFLSRSSISFLTRTLILMSFLSFIAYKVGLWPDSPFWGSHSPRASMGQVPQFRIGAVGSPHLPTPRLPPVQNLSQPSCVFPRLDLHEPAIMKFLVKYPRLECPTEQDWLVIEEGRFMLQEAATSRHPDIRCQAYPIVQLTDFKTRELDPVQDVQNNTIISHDFYRVECTSSDGSKYHNYLAGIRYDEAVQTRPKVNTSQGLGLDVIMLGLDSTSHLAWQRHLPKSRRFFVDVLKGIEMEGYNILGDGTPAAIMPILLGHREEELHEARRNYPGAKQVDDFPWVWNQFRSAGYAVTWAEDDAALGTFQYRLLGFNSPPTDHYFRTFCVAVEPKYNQFLPDCLGSRPRHSVVLDYMNQVFSVYPDRPKWMFSFQAQLSHSDNNYLSKMDDDLLNHLQRMHTQKRLDNALFIMMADHGGRFNKVRATAQGKLEERLPYLGIRLPEWFQQKYPNIAKNIQTNAQRLTTPFDIHETLMEVLNFTGDGLADISKRGVSLFKEISPERDCKAAQVDPHWCACLQWHDVDLASPVVHQVASKILDTFNNFTFPYRNMCSLLSLDKILSASALKVDEAVLKFKDTNDGGRGRFGKMTDTTKHSKILYQVTLITHPGQGRFEVTVTHDLVKGSFDLDKKDISRTNKYGIQPWCVEKQDSFQRPFCYCKLQPKD